MYVEILSLEEIWTQEEDLERDLEPMKIESITNIKLSSRLVTEDNE